MKSFVLIRKEKKGGHKILFFLGQIKKNGTTIPFVFLEEVGF